MTTLPYTPSCPHILLPHGVLAVWIGGAWRGASTRTDRVAMLKGLENHFVRRTAGGHSPTPDGPPPFVADDDTVREWRLACVRLGAQLPNSRRKAVELFDGERWAVIGDTAGLSDGSALDNAAKKIAAPIYDDHAALEALYRRAMAAKAMA